MRLTKGQLKRIIREEYSKLKRRGLIRESFGDGIPRDTWGVGARNARASRQPTLPETLEVCEIIKSFGGHCNTNVYAPGEEYSDEHREVTIGRVGDAVVTVTVTPDSFSAQISEGEKGYEKAELPGQRSHVNPNDFFARGQDFHCYSIEEFEQCLQGAMTDYERPMRSRKRRPGARRAGYDHFRNR